MTVPEMKPALSHTQMCDLLRARGLACPPGGEVENFLLDNNYYRFSGYMRYFQVDPGSGDNNFLPGTAFSDIKYAYEFDAELSRWLFDALAQIEVVFRSRFAYEIANTLAPDRYLEPGDFTGAPDAISDLLDAIEKDLDRSREPFVVHHRRKRAPVPIWVAVETMSFGTVSKMYSLYRDNRVRRSVSDAFDVPHRISTNTFQSLSILRNVCAHHGRIWNRTTGTPSKVDDRLKVEADRSIYHETPWGWIVIVQHLMGVLQGNRSYAEQMESELFSASPRLVEGLKWPRAT